ncbi:MAG: hypothetical protein WC517_04220 [Patescibacteria group bacterium]
MYDYEVELYYKDMHPDSDDIGQSADVGILMATGSAEMNPPIKVGDLVEMITPQQMRLGDQKIISVEDFGTRAVEEIRYLHVLEHLSDRLRVLGWVFRTIDYPGILFPTRHFCKL